MSRKRTLAEVEWNDHPSEPKASKKQKLSENTNKNAFKAADNISQKKPTKPVTHAKDQNVDESKEEILVIFKTSEDMRTETETNKKEKEKKKESKTFLVCELSTAVPVLLKNINDGEVPELFPEIPENAEKPKKYVIISDVARLSDFQRMVDIANSDNRQIPASLSQKELYGLFALIHGFDVTAIKYEKLHCVRCHKRYPSLFSKGCAIPHSERSTVVMFGRTMTEICHRCDKYHNQSAYCFIGDHTTDDKKYLGLRGTNTGLPDYDPEPEQCDNFSLDIWD